MPFTITYRTIDATSSRLVNRVHGYQPADRDEAVSVARHLSLDFPDTYIHIIQPSGWPVYRFLNGAFA